MTMLDLKNLKSSRERKSFFDFRCPSFFVQSQLRMSERDLYVYSFSVVFFHEMCLLVKILEKRIEKDIRFDEKEQSKNNQKWEVCTFSVFARLFGNRTNLQTATFFLCKCVLVHSICLFWFRIEAIEDMRSGESCLKTFCGRSLTDVCDMMGHNSWENWMAMVAGMVLHLTVFPLIVKVESPSYFQKTNILDSFVVSIFVVMLVELTNTGCQFNQYNY